VLARAAQISLGFGIRNPPDGGQNFQVINGAQTIGALKSAKEVSSDTEVLLRILFAKDPAQATMFGRPAAPSFVCRSSQAKKREEWQADFYASCPLMPRKLVVAAWDEAFPDRKQRVLQPATPIKHPFVEIERLRCGTSG
jgi:hypothetical protein